MSKKYKLDINKMLSSIDRRDMDFYESLDEDEKKGFAPPVALRFTSSAKGAAAEWYLAATNERANLHFWDIYEHPELQYKLLASCGAGSKVYHEWLPMAKGKKQSALYDFLSTYWPDANYTELTLLLDAFTEESFADFLNGSGVSEDDAKKIKGLFKEHKK